MKLSFTIPSMDFSAAGKASTEAKRVLARLGLDQALVKRIVIAMYEGEMNIAIHGGGGTAEMELSQDRVELTFQDRGPGIANLELAMTEGYSTASEEVRSMGFGAGMGLPNMKRNADRMDVQTAAGAGTKIFLAFDMPLGEPAL